MYADGDVPRRLGQVGGADLGRTAAMMRRLYPGWVIEAAGGSTLWDGVYPPDDRAYAAVSCSGLLGVQNVTVGR
ncbi:MULTISPECIES: DUF6928 family protein [unclassified Kitasatospora]|uniref:DUF6928 family protein n=1 Tax=unclassified Kitasatospora TaxID=2633591 RepID=UPI0037FB5ADC